MRIFGKCFVNILLQEIGDSLAQRILQTFFHTLLSPFRSSRFLGSNTTCLSCSLGSISLGFYLCRKLDEFITPDGVDELRSRLTVKGVGQDAPVSLLYPLNVNNWMVAALNMAAELGAPRIDRDVVRAA